MTNYTFKDYVGCILFKILYVTCPRKEVAALF